MSQRKLDTTPFRNEAIELLASIEQVVMELEKDPDNQDCIGQAFRVMHTIKGSGAMYGLEQIAAIAHDLEAVLDKVRNGELVICTEIIDIILEAKDILLHMIESPEGSIDTASFTSRLDVLLERDQKLSSMLHDSLTDNAGGGTNPVAENQYRIYFRPPLDIYKRGLLPDNLIKELGALGNLISVVITDNVPSLEEIDPELCYMSWEMHLITCRPLNDIKDIFMFVEDGSEVRIDHISGPGDNGNTPVAQNKQPHMAQGSEHPARTEAPAAATKTTLATYAENGSSIRVSSGKLDNLIDLVGELVTAQESFSQIISGWEEYDIADDQEEFLQRLRANNFEAISSLFSIAEQFTKLTAEIREKSMNIRMVPIGTVFNKYTRLVRDLSRQLGKSAKLIIEGGDTELDKNVIDKISDSLVHIIRNSIDHGIEAPDVRQKRGKPVEGTILLRAAYSGKNVHISITDDGNGIDLDRLTQKAIQAGIISSADGLSDMDRLNLIFAPGLSTSATVTDVSGRGVGMDVVKKSIEGLRGSISLNNRQGKGTEIRLSIPLTLAIIDGLLVRIGSSHYVFPLADVEECFEITREQLDLADRNRLVNLRGHLIPYSRLRETFDEKSEEPVFQHMVVSRIEDSRFGFVVDQIIGKHQTVIKSLSDLYKTKKFVSGGTILGDGTVSLILDAKELAEVSSEMDKHTATRAV